MVGFGGGTYLPKCDPIVCGERVSVKPGDVEGSALGDCGAGGDEGKRRGGDDRETWAKEQGAVEEKREDRHSLVRFKNIIIFLCKMNFLFNFLFFILLCMIKKKKLIYFFRSFIKKKFLF